MGQRVGHEEKERKEKKMTGVVRSKVRVVRMYIRSTGQE
jgi:hypothetical protein